MHTMQRRNTKHNIVNVKSSKFGGLGPVSYIHIQRFRPAVYLPQLQPHIVPCITLLAMHAVARPSLLIEIVVSEGFYTKRPIKRFHCGGRGDHAQQETFVFRILNIEHLISLDVGTQIYPIHSLKLADI